MSASSTQPFRVLAINGSYRDDGVTDSMLASVLEALQQSGATTEAIELRHYPIDFCLNCRECMRSPGSKPGSCVLDDAMSALVERIEAADAFVLAAPTNLGSVTALFKRFMERLAVYAIWPEGQPAPALRKAGLAPKKALLISSSAAPALVGRWLFSSCRQLRMTARCIGAKPVATLFCGLAGRDGPGCLPPGIVARAQKYARRLLPS
jgi:NAD(P)H-dependent FMN reductase